jgi:hypothetical protein
VAIASFRALRDFTPTTYILLAADAKECVEQRGFCLSRAGAGRSINVSLVFEAGINSSFSRKTAAPQPS